MQIQIISGLLGIVFIVVAYLVAVKKKLHLLRGYNQQRIRKKRQKFINLVSSFYLITGAVLIIVPFTLSWSWSATALEIMLILNLIILIYVNKTMVEKD